MSQYQPSDKINHFVHYLSVYNTSLIFSIYYNPSLLNADNFAKLYSVFSFMLSLSC